MNSQNRKRSNRLSYLKRENIKRIQAVSDYVIQNPELDEQTIDHLTRLNKNMGYCANNSLYGENMIEKDIKYVSSIFCGNKSCHICNSVKQKSIRRKYQDWFKKNQTLVRTVNGKGKVKVVTQTQFKAGKVKDYVHSEPVEYDLMHLTLTVPHYETTGFNGDLFYFKKIMELYKYLRNDSAFWNVKGEKDNWANWVYGGEFGVECTSGHWIRNRETKQHEYREQSNGLNIHIHSLLLVKVAQGNRNYLHKMILKEWNRLTVNNDSTREKLEDWHIEKIMKSNKTLTRDDVLSMNPKGTTMINLETIFSLDQHGNKVRTIDYGSDEMLKAVMEAISYHFEPHAFNKSTGEIDVSLLAKIITKVYGERLYSKFGCLQGEKSLNANNSPEMTKEEFEEVVELLVNEDTGEIMPTSQYFLVSPSFMFHDKEKDNKLFLSRKGRQYARVLNADTTGMAIDEMTRIVASENGKRPGKNDKPLGRYKPLPKQQQTPFREIGDNFHNEQPTERPATRKKRPAYNPDQFHETDYWPESIKELDNILNSC